MPDTSQLRAAVIAAASAFPPMPYRLDPPPDGVTTVDCSLFVQRVFGSLGIALPRTAEQQRRACTPIGWDDVQRGDLIFFENTYPAGDGVASHVGISLGAGSGRMWDAHERAGSPSAVGLTNILSDYWQEHISSAGRPPGLVEAVAPIPDGGLSREPEHRFTFEELYPVIAAAVREFGGDETVERVVSGILKQESGFRNYRVHLDGTGHGLIGLDDNGLAPDFMRWSGFTVARGADADIIPPELQIRYLAKIIAQDAAKYGDAFEAAREWHRGAGNRNDARGQNYEALIRAHIADLYRNGPPALPVPTEKPPSGEPAPSTGVPDQAAEIAALRERVSGLETAVAHLADILAGDRLQGIQEEARAIREQFLGKRPAA